MMITAHPHPPHQTNFLATTGIASFIPEHLTPRKCNCTNLPLPTIVLSHALSASLITTVWQGCIIKVTDHSSPRFLFPAKLLRLSVSVVEGNC
jgi:hypothetical protein